MINYQNNLLYYPLNNCLFVYPFVYSIIYVTYITYTHYLSIYKWKRQHTEGLTIKMLVGASDTDFFHYIKTSTPMSTNVLQN